MQRVQIGTPEVPGTSGVGWGLEEGSSVLLGSQSLEEDSRCWFHAGNFRLNPGSPPGMEEPCSSALRRGSSPLVCLHIARWV